MLYCHISVILENQGDVATSRQHENDLNDVLFIQPSPSTICLPTNQIANPILPLPMPPSTPTFNPPSPSQPLMSTNPSPPPYSIMIIDFSLITALFLALAVVSAVPCSECVGDAFDSTTLLTAVNDWIKNSTFAFDVYGNITTWCVGGVTSMESLFDGYFGRGDFNEDIGCWDVR